MPFSRPFQGACVNHLSVGKYWHWWFRSEEATMRKGVLAAAGLALLAAVSWSAAPAQAMAISAPAALKGASDSISSTETVHCWDCGYYGGPRYYRPLLPTVLPAVLSPLLPAVLSVLLLGLSAVLPALLSSVLPALLGRRLRLRLLRPAAAVLRRPKRLLVLAVAASSSTTQHARGESPSPERG